MSKELEERVYLCPENDRMAAILTCIGDGIISTDLNGIIDYMNLSAESITGWKQKEAVDKHINIVFPLVDAYTEEPISQLIFLAIERKSTTGLNNNLVLICKDGQRKFISASCSSIRKTDGDYSGVVIAFRDITRIKALEIERQNEQNNLQTIFSSAPVGMLIVDDENIINTVNDAALNFLNKKREDVIGERFGNSYGCLGSNEDKRGCGYGASCGLCDLRSSINFVLRTGKAITNVEYSKLFKQNGKEVEFWFRANITPILIEYKRNAVITLIDITNRKQMEIAAIKAKDFWEKMLENFPTPVWRADTKKKCDYINRTWEEFTGVQRGAALDIGWTNNIHPDDVEKCHKAFSEAFDKRETFRMEYRKFNSVGEYRWVLGIAKPYYDLEDKFAGYIGTIYDINDIKDTEKALVNSEEKFRQIFHSATDSIFVQSLKAQGMPGTILEVNETALRVWGYTREELLNMTTADLDNEKVEDQMKELNARFLERGYITDERTWVTKQKKHIYVEINRHLFFYNGQERILSVVRDITERKKAETLILESQKKYESLFVNMTDAFAYQKIIYDANGELADLEYIEVNAAYEKMFDIKAEDIVGNTIKNVFPVGGDNYIKSIRESYRKNKDFNSFKISEYSAITSERWFSVSGFSPSPGYMASITTEITERKISEIKLKKSQQKYRSLFMNMPNGFTFNKIIRDENGKPIDFEYIEINEAFEKLCKIPRKDIVGKRFTELFPDYVSSYQERMAVFGEVAETGESRTLNEVYSDLFGIWYSVSVFSPEKEYFVKIYNDVTEQKNAVREIKKAIKEAEAASKAKSEFLANMSHEIRTPLNGMMGMIDLTMLADLTADQQENLYTAKQCADSLLNIINDILDFSKMEAGKLSIQQINFNINELIEETIKIHNIKAMNKGLELNYQLSSMIPQILYGDPLRLQQVLNNLISNAVKFTDRGQVLLTVKLSQKVEDKIELLFSVCDTGMGIEEQDLGRLFKSFSQLDGTITKKHGGTGLGLVISKQLIEMMGGRIWVESEKGKGSNFSFTVSLTQGQGTLKQNKEFEIKPRNKAKHLKILLAEDDNINQRVIMKLLKERGYTVELASNGQEAVAMYIGKKYDVILMDIQMPEVDGIEATKKIRQIEQHYNIHTHIIAITAFALEGDRERFLALGMDDYLAKPIKVEELYNKLDNIISHEVRPTLIEGVALNSDGELVFKEKSEIVINDKTELVIKQISDYIAELELAMDTRDIEMVERISHKIKEYADSIDAHGLRSSAFRVELAARRGNIEETILNAMQLRYDFETERKSLGN